MFIKPVVIIKYYKTNKNIYNKEISFQNMLILFLCQLLCWTFLKCAYFSTSHVVSFFFSASELHHLKSWGSMFKNWHPAVEGHLVRQQVKLVCPPWFMVMDCSIPQPSLFCGIKDHHKNRHHIKYSPCQTWLLLLPPTKQGLVKGFLYYSLSITLKRIWVSKRAWYAPLVESAFLIDFILLNINSTELLCTNS